MLKYTSQFQNYLSGANTSQTLPLRINQNYSTRASLLATRINTNPYNVQSRVTRRDNSFTHRNNVQNGHLISKTAAVGQTVPSFCTCRSFSMNKQKLDQNFMTARQNEQNFLSTRRTSLPKHVPYSSERKNLSFIANLTKTDDRYVNTLQSIQNKISMALANSQQFVL